MKKENFNVGNFTKDTFNREIASYYKRQKENKDNFVENALIQPNRVTRSLYHCSLIAQKIFCYLIAEFQATKKLREKIKEEGKSDRWVTLDLTLNKYKVSTFGGKSDYERLKSVINEVCSLQLFIENDEQYVCMNVFEVGSFQKRNSSLNFHKVDFKFSEEFTNLLETNSKGCFTLCSLDNITKLDSFYAIRFYELAESWRGCEGLIAQSYLEEDWAKENITRPESTWCFGYSIEQLRTLFNLQNKYKATKDFIKNVIDKPIEQLNEIINDLEFKIEYKRYGRNQIRGVVFWVTNLESKKRPKKILCPKVSLWQQYLEKYKVIAEAFLDSVRMVEDYKNLSNEEQENLAIQLMNKNNYFI